MNKIEDKYIIECAISNGFRIPRRVKIQKTFWDKPLPYNKLIWCKITTRDVKVFAGGKDLGEYWIQYTGQLGVFVVKDCELKQFIRDKKIKQIGI